MNLFRIRGIQLSIHFSFFLLLAFVAQQGWDEAGWTGLLWYVAMLLAFFTCVVLHELGHSFTAMHFGVGVRRILLMPIGGMAEFDSIPREPSREFLITLAGPAVNFAIALVLGAVVGMPDGWPLNPQLSEDLVGFAHVLIHWNLVMGIFNLMPAFPMDGGRILRATLAMRLPYLRATFAAAVVGKVVAVAGALLAVFVFNAYMVAVLFAFIFVAGEMEYRAVRRREIDDANWRATLARFYPMPPPTEEPPILR